MKKFLLALVLALPMVLVGCSPTPQKSDEEIIKEQIAVIDSLLNSNAPITTNSFQVGEIEGLKLSAREMIYKGDTIPFLVIFGESRDWNGYSFGRNEGVAVVVPKEIKGICANIDSISAKVNTKVANTQNIAFSSNCGLTINANNSWGEDLPWDINVSTKYQGDASVNLTKEQLLLFKNLLMNSYVETDGYKNLNKLSLKSPQIRMLNKFY